MKYQQFKWGRGFFQSFYSSYINQIAKNKTMTQKTNQKSSPINFPLNSSVQINREPFLQFETIQLQKEEKKIQQYNAAITSEKLRNQREGDWFIY